MGPLNLYRTDGKQLGVVTSITLKEKPKTGLYCFSLYLKQDIKYSLNEDIQIWKSKQWLIPIHVVTGHYLGWLM